MEIEDTALYALYIALTKIANHLALHIASLEITIA